MKQSLLIPLFCVRVVNCRFLLFDFGMKRFTDIFSNGSLPLV